MAKRFFLVAAGMFLLVATYQLGASRAIAEWGNTGQIVGVSYPYVWDTSGRAWIVGSWTRDPAFDLPVPVGDVKFLTEEGDGQAALVTWSDVVWVNQGTAAHWQNKGTLPGPVSLEGTSFATTKSKYR